MRKANRAGPSVSGYPVTSTACLINKGPFLLSAANMFRPTEIVNLSKRAVHRSNGQTRWAESERLRIDCYCASELRAARFIFLVAEIWGKNKL
jgi:hypothetical protein